MLHYLLLLDTRPDAAASAIVLLFPRVAALVWTSALHYAESPPFRV